MEPKFAPAPQVASPFVPSWPVDDFLQLSDYESGDKVSLRSLMPSYGGSMTIGAITF